MNKAFLTVGFFGASAFAMYPAWPAWVQLDTTSAVVVTVTCGLALLSWLAARNPLASIGALLLPAVGWAASVQMHGPDADMLGWAAPWVATLAFSLVARWCLARLSRCDAGQVAGYSD